MSASQQTKNNTDANNTKHSKEILHTMNNVTHQTNPIQINIFSSAHDRRIIFKPHNSLTRQHTSNQNNKHPYIYKNYLYYTYRNALYLCLRNPHIKSTIIHIFAPPTHKTIHNIHYAPFVNARNYVCPAGLETEFLWAAHAKNFHTNMNNGAPNTPS